jgi:hypothetical protein
VWEDTGEVLDGRRKSRKQGSKKGRGREREEEEVIGVVGPGLAIGKVVHLFVLYSSCVCFFLLKEIFSFTFPYSFVLFPLFLGKDNFLIPKPLPFSSLGVVLMDVLSYMTRSCKESSLFHMPHHQKCCVGFQDCLVLFLVCLFFVYSFVLFILL